MLGWLPSFGPVAQQHLMESVHGAGSCPPRGQHVRGEEDLVPHSPLGRDPVPEDLPGPPLKVPTPTHQAGNQGFAHGPWGHWDRPWHLSSLALVPIWDDRLIFY